MSDFIAVFVGLAIIVVCLILHVPLIVSLFAGIISAVALVVIIETVKRNR